MGLAGTCCALQEVLFACVALASSAFTLKRHQCFTGLCDTPLQCHWEVRVRTSAARCVGLHAAGAGEAAGKRKMVIKPFKGVRPALSFSAG